MKKSFLLLALLFCGLIAEAQEKDTYQFVQRDSALYLDVYRPAHPRADRACVVALFGGGFVGGERDSRYQQEVARVLTEKGFTVVSIDYRLGLKDTVRLKEYTGVSGMQDMFQYCIDIAVEDCAAAVAWLCSHAAVLGIDRDRIVLTGSSAGAIAVLQLDWCRANGMRHTRALPAGWKPAAVVPYAGALMCTRGELKYDTPPAPTMLMHGTKDKIVAYKKLIPVLSRNLYGAHRVAEVFAKAGYPFWIVRFEGIGHEVATWLPGSVELFCAFVDQALAGRVTRLDATMTDSQLRPTKWTDMTLKDLYAE